MVVTLARNGRGDYHSNIADFISFLRGEYQLQSSLCIFHTCKQHPVHPLWDSTCTPISISPSEKKVMKNIKAVKCWMKTSTSAYTLHLGAAAEQQKWLLPLWFGTFYRISFGNKRFTRLANAGHMFALCIRHKKQVWCSEKCNHQVVRDSRTFLLPGISMVYPSKTLLANNVFLTLQQCFLQGNAACFVQWHQ